MSHLRLINWQPVQSTPRRPTVARLNRRIRQVVRFAVRALAAGVLFAAGAIAFLIALGEPVTTTKQPVSSPAPVCKIDRSV